VSCTELIRERFQWPVFVNMATDCRVPL